MPKFSFELLNTFRRSDALQRIALDETRLRQIVKNDRRKIIPVAAIARWLGVSNRQMWKWIDQGWISTYSRPSESYRKGISKPGFTRFLNRVKEQAALANDMLSTVPRGRPPVAREKLRAAYRAEVVTAGMTPKQCAEAVGISADSVCRALHAGDIPGRSRTRHRLCVGTMGSRPRRKVSQ